MTVWLSLRCRFVQEPDLSQHLGTSLVDCRGNPRGVAIACTPGQEKGSCASQGEARQVHDMSGKESGAAGRPPLPPSLQDL